MLSGHTKEKLLQVIRVLEGIKPQDFDLAIWYSGRPEHTPECGTVACAVGHAASDPWFTERGFVIRDDGPFHSLVPCYNEHTIWRAIEEFFDLPEDQAKWLFCHRSYIGAEIDNSSQITPQMVIRRIRQYMGLR